MLTQIGLPFRVVVSNIEEQVPPGLAPAEIVTRLAREKARAVAAGLNAGLVLGADTIVVYQRQILGKPADQAEAAVMLQKLQGDTHEVYTGVALLDVASGRSATAYERTEVTFRPLSPEEIRRYVATGEPLDKAGAYGAQGRGAAFVERIVGCYNNVVGLPLSRLALMLQDFSNKSSSNS